MDVFTRYLAGDKKAEKIINETAESLSILCINISRILDPEYIIIGGGMSLAGDVFLNLILSNFQKRSWTVLDDNVRIVLASNGKNAGIIGAALHGSICNNDTQKDLMTESSVHHYDKIVTSSEQEKVEESTSSESEKVTSPARIKAVRSLDVLNYMHVNRDTNSCDNLALHLIQPNQHQFEVNSSDSEKDTKIHLQEMKNSEEKDNSKKDGSNQNSVKSFLFISGIFSFATAGFIVYNYKNASPLITLNNDDKDLVPVLKCNINEIFKWENDKMNIVKYSAIISYICYSCYTLIYPKKCD